MNHLLNLTKKELKELLTPGTIVSILMVVIILSVVGNAISGSEGETTAPKDVGIVYGGNHDEAILSDGTSLEGILVSAYVNTYYGGKDPMQHIEDAKNHIHYLSAPFGNNDAITKEMKEKGCSYALAVPLELKDNLNNKTPTHISTYYSYTNGGLMNTASSTSGTVFVSNINQVISAELIKEGGLDAAFVKSPLTNESYTEVKGTVYGNLTPYEIYSAIMGQNMVVPIIVMIVIIMVGSIVISSMGSEKENKTLETLLTMPIKRTTIVSGKLLAAAIMGLVYGVCYLVGMVFYSKGLTSGLTSSVNLADYGIAMEPLDWAILMALLFLSIFSALGICMILGAFTKNYKMAQTMTMPISGLALVPMFVFMFTSWGNLPVIGQALMFLIPFTHPMIGMDNLMFGNMELVLGGIIYLLVFDLLMIFITVKIYSSDILITGLGQSKNVQKIRKLLKTKGTEHENH